MAARAHSAAGAMLLLPSLLLLFLLPLALLPSGAEASAAAVASPSRVRLRAAQGVRARSSSLGAIHPALQARVLPERFVRGRPGAFGMPELQRMRFTGAQSSKDSKDPDPFDSVDDDSDEWESDSDDLESPVYVDRDGKKMTEEEYYFKVLGKPMPKSSEESEADSPTPPPSKKSRKAKKERAPLTIQGEDAPRPTKGVRNMSRIERILDGSEPQAFKRLTLARFSCKEFEKKAIPDDLLIQLLGLTLRAPTSFNIQPYKVIMVTDDLLKLRLTGAMMDNNKEKILKAGATAVFLADKDAQQLVPKIERIKTPELAEELPRYIRLFSEKIHTPNEWAIKNTMIAASFYLLAATSLGLATGPIEGYNEKVVLKILGVPASRYSVPIIIPTGYPYGTGKFTKRLPPADVFYMNSLDEPAANVRAVTDSSLVE
eukprot:CAMPEP_0114529256 /NCGR_PEP_ID=MMETSP0109-20121206/24725_1 /TAXON_ID=29199 /ORGANISM="Chlorarachnion reptans, Strain CCCM449" /LENGTH=429 /DNA_ID=CAMNT_0001711621 /DNA_START=60 /DNA_END=1349 /DNA_ORIENTATION=-